MTLKAPVSVEADKHLRVVERLLDETLADLAGKGSSSPVLRSPDMLARILAELQRFAALMSEAQIDKASLLPRLKILLRRLSAAQRLLAAAAEFYRGWCAAGPAPSYPIPGYQTDASSQGPALLVVEG